MRHARFIFGPIAIVAVLVGSAGIAPAPLWAQEGESRQDGSEDSDDTGDEVKRERTIRLEQYGATLERPVGWVRAEPGEGAVVTLRAAGARNAQIEIRASSPVPKERRESFFAAFHSKLEEAGFEQTATRDRATYGGYTGRWTEYTGSSDRGTFRLVVWQLYRNKTAWMFVGFFPEPRADEYIDNFKSLLGSLSFD